MCQKHMCPAPRAADVRGGFIPLRGRKGAEGQRGGHEVCGGCVRWWMQRALQVLQGRTEQELSVKGLRVQGWRVQGLSLTVL